MILNDIYNYLLQSDSLAVFLKSKPSDSKIYPNYARMSCKTPYIVYRSSNVGGRIDEISSEEGCSFVITADSFADILEGSAILTSLLDCPPTQIASQNYDIYYSKKTGGSDYVDELGRHVRAINFSIKFKQN